MRRNGMGPIARSIANASEITAHLARRADRKMLPYEVRHADGAVRIEAARGGRLVVDESDWATLSVHRFSFSDTGVFLLRSGERPVQLSRLLMGASDGQVVDHINGDRSDNRRANLRICNSQENARNMALSRRSSSGFKGVCRTGLKYRAYAMLDSKQRHLGSFVAPEDAARAYDDFARTHFGEFACVNFPRAGEQSVHRRKVG